MVAPQPTNACSTIPMTTERRLGARRSRRCRPRLARDLADAVREGHRGTVNHVVTTPVATGRSTARTRGRSKGEERWPRFASPKFLQKGRCWTITKNKKPFSVSPKFLQEWGGIGGIHEDSRGLTETEKAKESRSLPMKDERHRRVGKSLSTDFESLLPLSKKSDRCALFRSGRNGAFRQSGAAGCGAGPKWCGEWCGPAAVGADAEGVVEGCAFNMPAQKDSTNKREAQLLTEISDLVHGVTMPFACGGTLVPNKPVTLRFKDGVSIPVRRTDRDEAGSATLDDLVARCTPAPLGRARRRSSIGPCATRAS